MFSFLYFRSHPRRVDFRAFARAVFRLGIVCFFLSGGAALLRANVPAAVVSGSSPNVTLTDGGTTVTLSNGIVSIVCTKAGATINKINYTYNNGGSVKTTQLLNAGTDGGMLYWEYGGFGGSASTYSIVVNPANGDTNHHIGDYAEIDLLSTSSTNGTVDVHFSMLRGSPGFYVTAIWSHRAGDAAMGMGETRTNIYAGSIFNWMSVDPARNKLMEVSTSATSIPVPGAPVECYLWTNGIYQGRYDDKYKYSADFGDEQYSATPGPHRVWGWSSVGSGGLNVGLWDVNASSEYYNCGPMKRELMCHIGTTILNMFNGDHYAEGADASFAAGEVWNKVYGPYFVYCNNVSTSVTDPVQASRTLYNDAVAQAAAEASGTSGATGAAEGATSWPYGWFYNTNYAPPSGRGAVAGRIVISDTGNPNASGSNLWVGVVQQPASSLPTYDFQYWMKPYEFWTLTDGSGNFTIPNVVAGTNYTLYAFGPGAEGEFMSQNQTGGNPPILYNVPATPFSVTVTGSATSDLGDVSWTPTRVGATVFEIGYPDRTARKFRHGDDFWVGDIGSSPTTPSPIWTKYLEYPFDFPNGMTYTVGKSRWTTDWDFVQPVLTSTAGAYNNSAGTIAFTLPSAPATGSQASIYLGLASNFADATIITVNGYNLGSTAGVTSIPNSNNANGYYSPYGDCDTTIREGNNGLFADERLTFPGTFLKSGTNINTITIALRQTGGTYFADHLMYDYFRLELTGYVPPPPPSVTAYPGNNSMLLSWPVTPGATSYNILRTMTSGTGYSSIAAGVTGPVCGSGPSNDTWLDASATNGTTYYYIVQSVNPTGTSASSAQSAGAAPSSAAPTSPPAAPVGLTATPGNGQVSLTWTAPASANYYTIQRTTLVNNGGTLLSGSVTTAETYNTLGALTLTNTATGTSYTDATTTNGSTYNYTVTPVNAAGAGSPATTANAVPLAPSPTVASTLAAKPGAGQVTLNWTPAPGAVGYVIETATAAAGPYTLLASVTYLTYTVSGLADNTPYYYMVAATNSGGSINSNVATATTSLSPPASLTATPGNTQVTLTWPAVAGATSYAVQRAGVTGGPYTTIGAAPGPSYTDGGLANGTPYFYVVASTNANGTGDTSPEAAATPSASLCLAPTNLTATVTNGQIFLAWNASAGAASYVVMRATINGGPYSIISSAVTAPTYTDTKVSGGPTYYYVVAATNAAGTGADSNQAATSLGGPPSLLWTGSLSSAWDFATANWINGSGAATIYSDGANVVFPDGATSGAVSISTTVAPATVAFTNDTLAYTVNSSGAGISGATAVIMTGNGSVTLTGAESYTGGTTIGSGTYALGADSSSSAATVESPGLTGGTNASLGAVSGGVLVNGGGQIRFGGVAGATVYTFIIPNHITLDGGSIYDADGLQELIGGLAINSGGANLVTTWTGKNLRIHSALSGSGNITIDDWAAPGDTAGGLVLVDTASNSYSGFITINAPSAGFLGGVLEIGNSTALGNATIVDNNTSASGLLFTTNSPQTGALAGNGNIPLSSTRTALTAGANGASTTYSGVLSGGGAFTKAGAGTMILAGSNTYTGATTVTGGILEITGAIAGAKSLSVSSGAVLYLAGGTLQIAGAITNNGLMKLSGSASVTLTGAFTNNGILDLINGPQTLPAGFINNGTVLTAGSLQVQQLAMSGSSFALTIQGYPQHTYQLQFTPSLAAPITWTGVGASQTGAGAPLIFTDTGASSMQGYYQILVSP